MTYTIKISSEFPCLISIGNLQKHIQNLSDFVLLDALEEKELFITCHPTIPTYQNQKLLPFTSNLNLENLNQSDTERLDITLLEKNNLSITIKPFLIMDVQTFKTINKSFQINGQTHTATLHIGKPCVFSISFQKQIYFETLTCLQQDFKVQTLGNYVFVEFQSTSPSLVIVLKFKNEYAMIDNLKAQVIEYEKDKIQIYSECNDMAKHGKIITYTLHNSQIQREVSFVYSNKKPQLVKNENLIPYAFFEALKVENYKLARFYLCQELNNKLTNEHLKIYFKDFINVLPAHNKDFSENKVCLVYQKNKIKECKMFDCRIENCKIKNIFAVE